MEVTLKGKAGGVIDIMLDGEEVGYMDTYFQREGETDEDSPVYIMNMEVYKDHQNKGIGTKALTQISKKLLHGVFLAPDNEDAQRLYARLGESYEPEADVDEGFGVYLIDL